jgi:hypothetical protein
LVVIEGVPDGRNWTHTEVNRALLALLEFQHE